jgi:hypothetical protein
MFPNIAGFVLTGLITMSSALAADNDEITSKKIMKSEIICIFKKFPLPVLIL